MQNRFHNVQSSLPAGHKLLQLDFNNLLFLVRLLRSAMNCLRATSELPCLTRVGLNSFEAHYASTVKWPICLVRLVLEGKTQSSVKCFVPLLTIDRTIEFCTERCKTSSRNLIRKRRKKVGGNLETSSEGFLTIHCGRDNPILAFISFSVHFPQQARSSRKSYMYQG